MGTISAAGSKKLLEGFGPSYLDLTLSKNYLLIVLKKRSLNEHVQS